MTKSFRPGARARHAAHRDVRFLRDERSRRPRHQRRGLGRNPTVGQPRTPRRCGIGWGNRPGHESSHCWRVPRRGKPTALQEVEISAALADRTDSGCSYGRPGDTTVANGRSRSGRSHFPGAGSSHGRGLGNWESRRLSFWNTSGRRCYGSGDLCAPPRAAGRALVRGSGTRWKPGPSSPETTVRRPSRAEDGASELVHGGSRLRACPACTCRQGDALREVPVTTPIHTV